MKLSISEISIKQQNLDKIESAYNKLFNVVLKCDLSGISSLNEFSDYIDGERSDLLWEIKNTIKHETVI